MGIVNRYIVADLSILISFDKEQKNGSQLLPSFEPFRVSEEEFSNHGEFFFNLHVDDNLKPLNKIELDRIKTVDTGNGETIVDLIKDGGYQFIVKDIFGGSCCLLQTDKYFKNCKCALNGNENMRMFGLNNALMLIFAFAGSRIDVILLHASLVRKDGWGYAFTAKSGTGKSTQVSMWLRYIPCCDLMNDDNPIIRIIDGTPYIYGGPWSGKTPCYRNVKAKLGAIVSIKRNVKNNVERLSTLEAFANIISSCSTMKWDKDVVNNICNIASKIIETTPNYNLFCRPDKESAILCHQTISRREK